MWRAWRATTARISRLATAAAAASTHAQAAPVIRHSTRGSSKKREEENWLRCQASSVSRIAARASKCHGGAPCEAAPACLCVGRTARPLREHLRASQRANVRPSLERRFLRRRDLCARRSNCSGQFNDANGNVSLFLRRRMTNTPADGASAVGPKLASQRQSNRVLPLDLAPRLLLLRYSHNRTYAKTRCAPLLQLPAECWWRCRSPLCALSMHLMGAHLAPSFPKRRRRFASDWRAHSMRTVSHKRKPHATRRGKKRHDKKAGAARESD